MQPTDPDTTIRRGTPADAAGLADLARRTFVDAFGPDNTPDDLAAFLTATYAPEIQRRELEDPSITYLVMERGGAPLAYAMLRAGHPSPMVGDPHAIEIQRFYVDRSAHGTGVAQRLMVACLTEAQALGAAEVFLGVWERNARALRFYTAQGFRPVGTQVFHVGSDAQQDLVLSRPLPGPRTA